MAASVVGTNGEVLDRVNGGREAGRGSEGFFLVLASTRLRMGKCGGELPGEAPLVGYSKKALSPLGVGDNISTPQPRFPKSRNSKRTN